MLRLRLVAALAVILPLIFFPASDIEAGKPRVYRIAGAAKDEKGKTVPAEQLAFDGSGLKLTMRYLDGPARLAALFSVLGREIDLFPERSNASRGFLVFAFSIENHAEGDLLFEPGQCRFISDRLDAEFPLDYSSLYEILTSLPSGSPSLEEVKKAVFSEVATIRPGGAVRKLLVFPAPREERFKEFEIRIGALHQSGGDLDATFKFKRFRVEP
jgi:hypothetical protein